MIADDFEEDEKFFEWAGELKKNRVRRQNQGFKSPV